MKCEMIRDLLPLYIDDLTSEESNKNIERHLKSCKECKMYYQEMTGEISNKISITEADIRDVELIKNINKKKKRQIIYAVLGTIAIFVITLALILPNIYKSQVKYEDVELSYGTRGNIAYLTMKPKSGYSLAFTGNGGGENSYLKMLSLKKSLNYENSGMEWECELGSEDDPCRWTLEFEDKIVVIENGKMIEKKDNK